MIRGETNSAFKHNEVSRSRGWHWTLVVDERDLEREAEMHATPFRAVVVVGCRAAQRKLTQVPLLLRIYARLYANFCRDIPPNARASERAGERPVSSDQRLCVFFGVKSVYLFVNSALTDGGFGGKGS
jgi:hypothetical protein